MSLRGGLLVPPVSLVVVPPIRLVVQPKTILRPRRTRLGGLLERSDRHGEATRRADSWRASISSSGHTHEAEALAAASEDTIGNGFTIGKRTIAAWALERVLVRGYDTLEGTVGWTSGGGEGVCCCCCCCCSRRRGNDHRHEEQEPPTWDRPPYPGTWWHRFACPRPCVSRAVLSLFDSRASGPLLLLRDRRRRRAARRKPAERVRALARLRTTTYAVGIPSYVARRRYRSVADSHQPCAMLLTNGHPVFIPIYLKDQCVYDGYYLLPK